MALHTKNTQYGRTTPNETYAQAAAEEGITPRAELNTWLANYQIDPERLRRNEQKALVMVFKWYWDEWFESTELPNPQTSLTLGNFTALLQTLAKH